MNQAQAILTPLPVGTSLIPGTLRAEMDARRAAGRSFDVREALRIIVPLCTQLAELHGQGAKLFVNPSSLGYTPERGIRVIEHLAGTAPSLPRDRACLAPEERSGAPGDARGSVFAVGAILYELLTGASVGPGMRRPAEVIPDLPPTLEGVMGKALVADPKLRPADLGALAQALHNVSPAASMRPPMASDVLLDEDGIEVNVSMSMIPPSVAPVGGVGAPAIPSAPALPRFQAVSNEGPYAVAIPAARPPVRNANDPTQKLADLKASLESDPRPRYVVVKGGMDHGPFSAVELLQQVASGQFAGTDVLRDSFLREERAIQDWEEFAPFAEQAKLNRDIVQEKKAFEEVVQKERQGMQYKALIGVALMGVILAAGGGFWLRRRATQQKELAVQDRSGTIEVDVKSGLTNPNKQGGPGAGGTRPAGGGNYPVLGGGMSCEAAQARYVEEYKMGSSGTPADLTAGAYGAVLNKGSYLNSCGVPSSMSVNICAAVQNGRAVGVTVSTNPSNPGIASCVAGQIRGIGFPSHPRLDVTRTTFAAN
ncbi:hypothetical protein [Chondromyces apiculatus]|uniref:Protein kinase domain-containing protein n=1 Tax=Chondromyces apiculatus DSM 436 TaxID=1192034 RepID=A0A017TFL9_9BACT|nr:hypothetical protein [Chondromyces apiculatus]EYF07610.1 Hypothetical protein CAP_8111 [Chondromyces apiculatus DSM 436]